jgi:hypothetical protein
MDEAVQNQSGGVDVNADQVSVGGDVASRDKIEQRTSNRISIVFTAEYPVWWKGCANLWQECNPTKRWGLFHHCRKIAQIVRS